MAISIKNTLQSTHSVLNADISFNVVSQDEVRNKFCNFVMAEPLFDLISDENFSDGLSKRLANWTNFVKDLAHIANSLHLDPSTFSKLLPHETLLSLIQYVVFKLSQRVEKLKLVSPHSPLITQWNTIRFSLANLRQYPSHQNINNIQSFIIKTKKELEKNNFLESDILPEICEFLRRNNNTMDHPIIYFLSRAEGKELLATYSIKLIEEMISKYLDLARLSCDWALKEVENILSDFASLPQHEIINPSKAALETIQVCRKKNLPNIIKVTSQNIAGLVDRKKICDDLNQASTLDNHVAFNGVHVVHYVYQILISEVLEENKNASDETEINLDTFYQLESIQAKLGQKCPQSKDLVLNGLGSWKCGDLRKLANFVKVRNLCRTLIGSYLSSPLSAFSTLYSHIYSWYTKNGVKGIKLLQKEKLPMQWVADGSQLTVEELAEQIESTFSTSKQQTQTNSSSNNAKKGGNKKGKSPTKQEAQKTAVAVQSVAKKKSIQPPTLTKTTATLHPPTVTTTTSTTATTLTTTTTKITSNSLTPSPKKASSNPSNSRSKELSVDALQVQMRTLATTLRQKINAETSPKLRDTLRSAEMFLQDLATLHTSEMAHLSKEERLYHLFSQTNALFYFLEQIFRSAHPDSLENVPQHNLAALSEGLSLKLEESEVINRMNVAGYWTRDYHQQLARSDHLQIPLHPTLRMIQEAVQHSEFDSLKNKLDQDMKISLKLAEKLLGRSSSVSETPSIELKIKQNPFQHFTIAPLMEPLKKVIVQANFPENHFVATKLNQAVLNFNLFHSTLASLRQSSVNSDAFSLHLRNSVMWFNYGIENLLKACYCLQSGLEMETHSLTQLAQAIDEYDEAGKQVSHPVLNQFHEMSRLGRYVFNSLTAGGSHTELQVLLLKAELLREHPECHEGFEIAKKETSLNYIALPQENSSADALLKKWASVVQEAIQWMEKSLLPQIHAGL